MLEAFLVPNSFVTDINSLNRDYPYRNESCIHRYLKEDKNFKWYLNCILKEEKLNYRKRKSKLNKRN